ncbi:prolyl-tRNA synthetase associated domain-containing protein [Jeotgalibaca porci]|uniref:prolyl-tRNA synthetase associated domain-containing protein n=1 Tax=Jeotgalibaca porci TaxID=1868793 RepID=UPI00359F756A
MHEEVLKKLNELAITYETVVHPPAFTTEEANQYIEGKAGVRTKSLFLTNRKKTAYYLLIMDDSKRLDITKFQESLAVKRLSFASPTKLTEKLGVEPGAVSIFGLLNNQEKDVQVYFDRDIITQEIMSFHPNFNEMTLFLKTSDILRFIEELGYTYHTVTL